MEYTGWGGNKHADIKLISIPSSFKTPDCRPVCMHRFPGVGTRYSDCRTAGCLIAVWPIILNIGVAREQHTCHGVLRIGYSVLSFPDCAQAKKKKEEKLETCSVTACPNSQLVPVMSFFLSFSISMSTPVCGRYP